METKVYTNSAVNADFLYDDADDYQNEIAELYSYSEDNDFKQNFSDFKIEAESSRLPPLEWRKWNNDTQCNFVMKIVDQLEHCNDKLRMRAARSILYLTQGCWSEVKTIEEQQHLTRKNVLLLYRTGVFQSMISLLNIELEKISHVEKAVGETGEIHVNTKDSIGLKLILNVLYIVVETIRCEQLKKNKDYSDIIEECISEIITPLADGMLLPIKLLNMVTKFCDGTGAHFPIKKLLLLQWKCSLLILGSSADLHCLKNNLRAKYGLIKIESDTLNISKRMHASIISSEETPMQKRPTNSAKRNRALWEVICENVDTSRNPTDIPKRLRRSSWSNDDEPAEIAETAMKYEKITKDLTQSSQNSLLFDPKVRLRDIEIFLQNAREKYFGYHLVGDNKTLIGLPLPVQESVQALKRHLYVSLSEKQIEEEQYKFKHPCSEDVIEQTAAEALYQALLPNFRKYITDLLRIMLASSPSAKLSTGSLSSRVVADMLPKNSNCATSYSPSLQTDIIRHKEIVVKSITAILLLYLKHFKVNHIYQFEYMSQLLSQSSFLKLTLQVFTPIIPEYVILKTTVPRREFPICVLEQSHDEYANELIYGANVVTDLTYTWRNLFSCINLMRILNKLVKWKNSRILNMVSLKSTSALKEVLQIRQPLLQIYVLKLLKMQAKYLGRCWRRNNLKVMTAIYTKVRHRFNDDWAYGCDTVAKFWNSQEEEFYLRIRVVRFHNRRYPNLTLDFELSNIRPSSKDENIIDNKTSKADGSYSYSENTDTNEVKLTENNQEQRLNYLLYTKNENEISSEVELSDSFKKNYETWLKNQVFVKNFNWDSI